MLASDLKIKLIKEIKKEPQFKDKDKVKVKDQDKNFCFYEILVEVNNFYLFRKVRDYIPVLSLQKNKNDQQFTNSKRNLPQGIAAVQDLACILNNFFMANVPEKKYKENDIVHVQLQNDDKSQDMVQYPIIWEKQLMGYLLPNQIFNEEFIVKHERHPGIKKIWNLYTHGLPGDEKKQQVKFLSFVPWSVLEKEFKKVKFEI